MGTKSRATPAQRQPSKHAVGYRKMLQAWTDESRVRFFSANHQLCAIELKWRNPSVALFLVCKLILGETKCGKQTKLGLVFREGLGTKMYKTGESPALDHRKEPS